MLLVFFAVDGFAQGDDQLTTRNQRARKSFERAIQSWRQHDDSRTITELRLAIESDPDFVEAHLLLGEVYFSREYYQESIPSYQRALEIDPDFFPQARYYLGSSLLKTGQYAEAKEQFQAYLGLENISENLKNASEAGLKTCEFALKSMANPVPFNPGNLGDSINSVFPEYSPTLTTDERTLIFTRKIPRMESYGPSANHFHEDFFISQMGEEGWSAASNLGPPINTGGNEGAQSLSADGRHLFFTACNRQDGMGSCDIYFAQRTGREWSFPANLGPVVNSGAWDSQPSISPDGKTLFFSSARNGSLGKMDIWQTTLGEDGEWSYPINLGPGINTEGREMSPFIHPDNETLFFASDGHPGMGGLDIFFSRRDSLGQWSEPVNLGYPINSYGDEFSLIVGAGGINAYFASDLYGGFGDTDIYHFELYEAARPTPVTFMRGVVFDKENGHKLRATFELTELETGQVIMESTSDRQTGEFLVAIPTGKLLGLNVSHPDFLFFSEHFSYEETRTGADPYLRDIPLHPIREGEAVVLRNIFFDTDRYDLKPASEAELLRLVRLLQSNPRMRIEISGHTDNVGSDAYNLELSKNRAQSVMQFLIDAGIDKSRLSFEGYADTQPLDNNDTEEGRANNRRTEFKIMDF
ncbi:MAG: OmpA family protein [Bacteroides sp.]|nr:OmpA family protein [Bacteroides sp.]